MPTPAIQHKRSQCLLWRSLSEQRACDSAEARADAEQDPARNTCISEKWR